MGFCSDIIQEQIIYYYKFARIQAIQLLHLLEQCSIECCETKTKVITLTNHNKRRQPNDKSKREANTFSRLTPSAEERVRVNHDWFGFIFDWLRNWRDIF